MKNMIEDFYNTIYGAGFIPAPKQSNYCEAGTWQLNDKTGTGTFWIYNRQDLLTSKSTTSISMRILF